MPYVRKTWFTLLDHALNSAVYKMTRITPSLQGYSEGKVNTDTIILTKAPSTQ